MKIELQIERLYMAFLVGLTGRSFFIFGSEQIFREPKKMKKFYFLQIFRAFIMVGFLFGLQGVHPGGVGDRVLRADERDGGELQPHRVSAAGKVGGLRAGTLHRHEEVRTHITHEH